MANEDKKDIRHLTIMVENLQHQFERVIEIMVGMREQMNTLATKESVEKLRDELKLTNLVVRKNNRTIQNHENRIAHLEAGS